MVGVNVLCLGVMLLGAALVDVAVCGKPAPKEPPYVDVNPKDADMVEHVNDVAEWAVDNIEDATDSQFALKLEKVLTSQHKQFQGDHYNLTFLMGESNCPPHDFQRKPTDIRRPPPHVKPGQCKITHYSECSAEVYENPHKAFIQMMFWACEASNYGRKFDEVHPDFGQIVPIMPK